MLRLLVERMKINEVSPGSEIIHSTLLQETIQDESVEGSSQQCSNVVDHESSDTTCQDIYQENKENLCTEATSESTSEKYCQKCADLQNFEFCTSCFPPILESKTSGMQLPSISSTQHGEKRKHSGSYSSRLKFPSFTNNSCSDSSSDDEIKDLCSKYKCVSATTPERKLSRSLWKSHSRIICVDRIGVRPSLNLEKMQEKLLKKQKPRIVKVKAIRPIPDDDVVVFKPIVSSDYSSRFLPVEGFSNHLIPVEEPLQQKFVF